MRVKKAANEKETNRQKSTNDGFSYKEQKNGNKNWYGKRKKEGRGEN
jgi:hypothetical protein